MAWSTGRSIGHLGETKCEDCCDISCMLWPWSSLKFCFCNNNAWTLLLTCTQFINSFKLFRGLPLLRVKLQEMKRKSHIFVKYLKLFFCFLDSMISVPEDLRLSYFLQTSFYSVNFYHTFRFNNKALVFSFRCLFLQNVCFCRHGEDMIVTPFAQVSNFMYVWCKKS